MSTSIDQAFIRDYVAEVHQVFQKRGSILLSAVRHKANVVGSSSTFQKVGKGTATTKARHGTITPMNQTHTNHEATLVDFYAGDYVDKLDEAKTNIDERMVIASGGAMALGRKIDEQITTILDSTSQTTVSWAVTNKGTNQAALLGMVEALYSNDVQDDGMNYAALTSRAWAQAMTVESFGSADFVGSNGLPFTEGAPVHRWKDWMNVKWTVHTGLPGKGTATAKCFAWNKNSIGYASAAAPGNVAASDTTAISGSVGADIDWEGSRAAHFVNHFMSGGGVMIDDTGVIEANLDDTAAIAST